LAPITDPDRNPISRGTEGSNPSPSSEESRTNRPAARRGSAWRVLDALDYWLTLTRLRILDALCGEGVEMTADEWEQALRLKSSDCSAPRSPSLPRSRPWRLITPREPAPAGAWPGSLPRELIPPPALRDEARRRASADWLYPSSVTARAGSESEQPNTARRQ
jgi:hypothetical protein